MWFVVSTGMGMENAAKDYLLEKVRGAKEVYITPYRKIQHIDRNGKTVETVAPVLTNYVFVNIKLVKRVSSKFFGIRTNAGEKTMVFRQLAKCLDRGGYFCHRVRVYDTDEGSYTTKYVKSAFHLLCANPFDTPLEQIMEQSRVPDAAMDAFMVYNSQAFSSADQLRVEPVAYGELIKEHDVVRVLRGQFAGQEGVVKRSHKGKSDRRLYIEFSNNLCLSISGIHQNDVAIVHEATKGKEAKEVSLWRDIDAVIGSLQFNGHPDDAPKELRSLLRSYGQTPSELLPNLSDADRIKAEKEKERVVSNHKREVLAQISPRVRNEFKVLGDFFGTQASMHSIVLREYIPNTPIRPFLTPTAGTELDGENYTILHHNGFDEYVVRMNLSEYFRTDAYDKKKYEPVFDEDYQYYAHVTIVEDNGLRKAIAPWGGFYDKFANLSIPQLKELAETLQKRKYAKTFQLLDMQRYMDEANDGSGNNTTDQTSPTCIFEKVNGIGGFSMAIGGEGDYKTVKKLIDTIVPVAVELWQGTRLSEWRQVLQRYVLLHKVPIIDQPSVIEEDGKLEVLFNAKTPEGLPDWNVIADGLKDYSLKARKAYDEGNIYKSVSIFLKVAKQTGASFVDNELYNYLGENGYEPDAICTKIYDELIAPIQDPQIKKFLHRGYAELSEKDAWKYFHLPSFLKKALRTAKTGASINSLKVRTT